MRNTSSQSSMIFFSFFDFIFSILFILIIFAFFFSFFIVIIGIFIIFVVVVVVVVATTLPQIGKEDRRWVQFLGEDEGCSADRVVHCHPHAKSLEGGRVGRNRRGDFGEDEGRVDGGDNELRDAEGEHAPLAHAHVLVDDPQHESARDEHRQRSGEIDEDEAHRRRLAGDPAPRAAVRERRAEEERQRRRKARPAQRRRDARHDGPLDAGARGWLGEARDGDDEQEDDVEDLDAA